MNCADAFVLSQK